ncbi:transcriptional regulator family: C2H2 zinc finger and Fungal Specific TF [Paecilomyces variotii]|nr:transcriptional regulator family: Fungal Specific TF and C2H2 zinc finger [Paecilomyces variotii]KAJ9336363.1 transcriptional regulator family: C2H2 zinc finger and Fungal Specific TF [Paecilomyces variotii]
MTEVEVRSFLCSICHQSFRRREHLRRHILSHGDIFPYTCSFCDASFKRRDALTRHLTTCKIRKKNGIGIPTAGPKQPRGKRPTACDRCRRSKRACNLGFPCDTCIQRQTSCTYGNLADMVDGGDLEELQLFDELSTFHVFNSSNPGFPLDKPINGSQTLFVGSTSGSERYLKCLGDHRDDTGSMRLFDRLQSLRFLEHFTRSTGIAESFECGETSDSITDCMVSMEMNLSAYSQDGYTHDSDSFRMAGYSEGYPQPPCESLLRGFETFNQGNYSPLMLTLPYPTRYSQLYDEEGASAFQSHNLVSTPIPIADLHSLDPLSERTHSIIGSLRRTVSGKCHSWSQSWSSVTEELCLKLFSPSRIRLFLNLFWSQWHPNCPIIHKPTFNAEIAPEELLCPMVVLGACTSPDIAHRKIAGFWFDIVEELVFTSPLLDFECSRSYSCDCNRPVSRKKLQALQGAYCVCLYQNWDGSDKAKRRIRNQCFTVLVTAARDIGFEFATHDQLEMNDPGQFDWGRWVVTEELMRTMSYIFLIDSAFAIFNNLPPRFVISELKLGLCYPESCFQAECQNTCFQAIKRASRPPNARLSIASAVEALCHEEFGTRLITDFSHMSVLNMFCIVSALHIVLFTLRASISSPHLIQSIKKGFLNWDKIWMANAVYEQFAGRYDLQQEQPWKKIGFIRHCREYCFLGLVMCEKLRSETKGGENSIILSGISGRYDETDMRQVSELIRRLPMTTLSS